MPLRKPPKKVVEVEPSSDRVVLTAHGKACKHAYLDRRTKLTGNTKTLGDRYNGAALWNYVGRICASLDADPIYFVDKLIEFNGHREGFPYPTKLASGYAAKSYLQVQGITDINEFDEEGCLLPQALEKVRSRTLVSSKAAAIHRNIDDDMVLPVDEVNTTWAELNAGITIINKACGTTDMTDPKVTEFASRAFCVIAPHVFLLLAWRNLAVRTRFLEAGRKFLRENPDWLRNAEVLGLTNEVRSLRVIIGTRA